MLLDGTSRMVLDFFSGCPERFAGLGGRNDCMMLLDGISRMVLDFFSVCPERFVGLGGRNDCSEVVFHMLSSCSSESDLMLLLLLGFAVVLCRWVLRDCNRSSEVSSSRYKLLLSFFCSLGVIRNFPIRCPGDGWGALLRR